MATVRSHTRINRSAEEVWNVVSDAGNIAAWFPAVKTSSATGSTRSCELADGTPLEEDIVTSDPMLRRFQYRITGGIPVDAHLGTVDVLDDGQHCMVVYTTEIAPDALAETMGPTIEEGLRGLKRYCEDH